MAETKLQTHCSEPFPDGTCRLLLIGNTGSGKSATGNTIIGKTVFKIKVGMNSETKDGQFHQVERNNLRIQIMDTPGLVDTDGEDKILAEKITKAMLVMHPGPHAILLVLRCDRRFTQEEYNVYMALKDIFGANLSSFMIIVFTGIDVLQREGQRFEDQIQDKSKCPSLHSILDDIGGRYILFNNKATKEEKERQVDKLIEKIGELVQENGCIYFQHSFCSVLEESVRLMMAEELRLIKEKIKSTDVSSQVLCTTSFQSSGSSINICTKSQKHIKIPGNRAPEIRKEFNDERIKTPLPPALNRPVSEVPNVYTENQEFLETEHGNISNSDNDVKVKVKDMVNRFEVKYSDHNASNPDKPLSSFVRFPTGKPSEIYGERPVQMVRPTLTEDSMPQVFSDTDQHSMELPESCNPEDAEKSNVKELNFIDDETYLSEKELVQTFLQATGSWKKDIQMQFGNDMDDDTRYLGEVRLKQKMEDHLHQLSALQLQQYITTARDLECTTKEGMEKRTVPGSWQQDIDMQFENDMDDVTSRIGEVSLKQKRDPYLGEVSLKQKLVDHPDQLSALQLQQYDTMSRDLECAIKRGMEKRKVKKKHKCRLM